MALDQLLCTTDEMQASLIAGLLEDRGIPFYLHSASGAGLFYGLQNLVGVKIYVGALAYEEAKELVEAYFSANATLLEENAEGNAPKE